MKKHTLATKKSINYKHFLINYRWVVAIFLVVKLTSDDLLDRLKKKGTREPDYTRNLIIQKLNNDDDDVATTSLKVSVTCPLGKMRMKVRSRVIQEMPNKKLYHYIIEYGNQPSYYVMITTYRYHVDQVHVIIFSVSTDRHFC